MLIFFGGVGLFGGIPGGLGLFQPSPFDKLRAGSAGLDLLVCGTQGLTSWAKFSQTCLN